MEGYKPDKKPSAWTEAAKAAALAAGLAAVPMESAEAQHYSFEQTKVNPESRAEQVRECGGVITEAKVLQHEFLGKKGLQELFFKIVLDDEGTLDDVGFDFAIGTEAPFSLHDRITIKYRINKDYPGNFEIEEIRTEDGRVFGSEYFARG